MTTTSHAPTTGDLLAFAVLGCARLLRLALVHGVALVLLLTGYRPAVSAPARLLPAAATVRCDWAGRPLTCLTVTELRLIARAEGHKALARSGRRADLLAVLA
jgi:hypothetical protein